MIMLFLMASAAATSAPAERAPRVKTVVAAQPASPARTVIEAQLRSPPRPSDNARLNADEADAIYKSYLTSIGQRPERATDERSGNSQ